MINIGPVQTLKNEFQRRNLLLFLREKAGTLHMILE